MIDNKAVMQQAINALIENSLYASTKTLCETADAAIFALRAAIAQPEQTHDLQKRLEALDFYEDIAEHYAQCAISPAALRDWVAERMDMPAIAQPVEPAADKLLQIIAATYQIAGACDLPENILDVLANPERATQEQIDTMLPFVRPASEQNFCPRCGKRLGGTDDIHTCTPPGVQS